MSDAVVPEIRKDSGSGKCKTCGPDQNACNANDETGKAPERDTKIMGRDKLMPYTTNQSAAFISPQACRSLIKMPNVIVMVGLPARGKTYISRKLCRYLEWIGFTTKAFNLGDYRREEYQYENCDIFMPGSEQGGRIRNECAQRALEDMGRYLEGGRGEVAIFDATNTTRDRRRMLLEFCCKKHMFRVFFVESICDDPNIIETNIQDVKVNSPDYRGMDKEKAKEDFMRRIEHYRDQYEPLDVSIEDPLSFIRVFNAGRSFFVHNVIGHVQSRVVYFLMNIHLMPRCIYLTRHGESEYNRMGRLGGDGPLSTSGQEYAEKLAAFFQREKVPDLRVWCSQKLRAAQTASYLEGVASYIEYWKALDEIDAGICEGLTYEEIAQRYPQQLDNRDQDKYSYRYPSGESYEDLTGRLEPVIMELERQANVLVVSHQAVLRCILAYFLNKKREDLPYLRVPLHSVIKLTPIAYGCKMDVIDFKILAVDTYRAKPQAEQREQRPSAGSINRPPVVTKSEPSQPIDMVDTVPEQSNVSSQRSHDERINTIPTRAEEQNNNKRSSSAHVLTSKEAV